MTDHRTPRDANAADAEGKKMSEKPFEDKDVLWRWTPDGLGECVFAKNPSSVYGVTLHCWFKDHWECATANMSIVVELLRQLTDAEADKQQAVAAERKRCRDEEVAVLIEALPEIARLDLLADWFDAQQEQNPRWRGCAVQIDLRTWAAKAENALAVVERIQKEKP